jgi:hypothetical protein
LRGGTSTKIAITYRLKAVLYDKKPAKKLGDLVGMGINA